MYFPAGIYKISSSIIDYHYTQGIGNPNNLPVIKASPSLINLSLLDGNPYGARSLGVKPINPFYRQAKNLILDTRSVPVNVSPRKIILLAGGSGSTTIAGWGQGHLYTPQGPADFQGPIPPISRAASLLDGDRLYEKSKPSYADRDVAAFLSARSAGALGDGVTDDTAVLQQLIDQAASSGRVVFFDAGFYKISQALHTPPGSKLVGEGYPVM